MKNQTEIKANPALLIELTGIDGGCGRIFFGGIKAEPLTVVWSCGGGWEHVSVSYRRRTPSWEEMCRVKDMFWNEEETVVQFHPKRSEYVNIHPHCLHLWRRCGEDYELPPKDFV